MLGGGEVSSQVMSPGHLWRDECTALNGSLSRCVELTGTRAWRLVDGGGLDFSEGEWEAGVVTLSHFCTFLNLCREVTCHTNSFPKLQIGASKSRKPMTKPRSNPS